MGENVEACLKRISVCAKSGPVGLAFCALMICECFWGTNPKFFRTNHAYAIGVSGKGCRRGERVSNEAFLNRETRLEALQLWSAGRAPTFSDSADGRKTMAP